MSQPMLQISFRSVYTRRKECLRSLKRQRKSTSNRTWSCRRNRKSFSQRLWSLSQRTRACPPRVWLRCSSISYRILEGRVPSTTRKPWRASNGFLTTSLSSICSWKNSLGDLFAFFSRNATRWSPRGTFALNHNYAEISNIWRLSFFALEVIKFAQLKFMNIDCPFLCKAWASLITRIW